MKLGGTTIGKMMLGAQEVRRAYLGSTLVYESDRWPAALALIPNTKGWAIDPNDDALIWNDTARTTPATPSAQFAAASSDSDPAGYLWQLDSNSFKPVWTTKAFNFDGVDDYIDADAADGSTINSCLNAVAGFTLCTKFRLDTVGTVQQIFAASRWNSPTFAGLQLFVTAAHELTLFCRRVDGDSGSTITTSGLSLQADTDYVATLRGDYPNGLLKLRVEGVEVASGAAPVGATSAASNVQRVRLGRSISNTNPLDGRIGRMIFLPFYASDAQAAILEAGVDVPLL